MATKTKSANTPAANGQPVTDVLTLAEAATFLRVGADELKSAADAGRVPGRLIGTEWRFVKTALVEWLSTASPPATGTDWQNTIIRKAFSSDPNAGFLAAIGAFADDKTLDAMTEEIYRERKRNPVEG